MRATIESTRSAVSTPQNFAPQARIAYRPAMHWTTKASAFLRASPVRVRGWARVYPERIEGMLRSQVLCGNRALAEDWMRRFEGAFIATPDSWEAAHRCAVRSDAHEDIERDDFTRCPTDTKERREYLNALRREIADKMRLLRALEAEER